MSRGKHSNIVIFYLFEICWNMRPCSYWHFLLCLMCRTEFCSSFSSFSCATIISILNHHLSTWWLQLSSSFFFSSCCSFNILVPVVCMIQEMMFVVIEVRTCLQSIKKREKNHLQAIMLLRFKKAIFPHCFLCRQSW